ncbi:MAG: GPW/gp25 family protein [Leptolyngbyaceae cyanobacterium SU_3_3]|nr:GPW/gp25 family protein [Leptolyngbyaceae cyanobacterium SU_3_3]
MVNGRSTPHLLEYTKTVCAVFYQVVMAKNEDRWGSDLQLLRNLERQNSRDRDNDLLTQVRTQTQQADLALLHGADNLRQALLLRFLTPVGELAPLGHPSYGSRLFELIGELNSDTNRNRAKLFVLQALAAEPRVKTVRSVLVSQRPPRSHLHEYPHFSNTC